MKARGSEQARRVDAALLGLQLSCCKSSSCNYFVFSLSFSLPPLLPPVVWQPRQQLAATEPAAVLEAALASARGKGLGLLTDKAGSNLVPSSCQILDSTDLRFVHRFTVIRLGSPSPSSPQLGASFGLPLRTVTRSQARLQSHSIRCRATCPEMRCWPKT